MPKYFLALLFAFCSVAQVYGQYQITGKVIDSETGEPLPAAHVIIKDTYKGTITNADGEFSLGVSELPVTLVARFIGFESQEKVVSNKSNPANFVLKPSVADMGEIVVTGEDPAIAIMREVIRRKKIWRANLETYQAEAYTRQQLKNDTSIVSITESISTAYWDKEKGSREVLRSKRQTANISGSDNFAGVSYLPNFYDDNLDIAGFDVVGVTHPDALSYYTFVLEDMQPLDGKPVYEISVTSNRKLQPLFEGTIYVLGEEYALLEVNLKPNSVIAFPPPVQDFNLTYSQQFSNFGGDFWLPVDVRINGLIEVGIVGLRFPPIGFKQIAKLNDYQVNITLPDSIFEEKRMVSTDSSTIHSGDSLFVKEVDLIPLSKEEELAYETIDSTVTLEKAFQPKGFLVRFLDLTIEQNNGEDSQQRRKETKGDSAQSATQGPSLLSKLRRNFSISGRYNRVDAFYGELKFDAAVIPKTLYVNATVGYSLGYESISYSGGLSWRPMINKKRRTSFFADYAAKTETRYHSRLYDPFITGFMPLLGYHDYYDYYRNEGFQIGGTHWVQALRADFKATYKLEEHSPINYKTSYDILGQSRIQRPNSYIDEGTLSAVELTLSSGSDRKAFGAIGAKDWMLSVEQSAKVLGSSWNYTRFEIDLFRRYETFYRRRFFPNTLDMRLNAGSYIGDLPVQKNGVLDAALGVLTPFGAFKTKRFIPYEGARYIALNAEHNFKSVPLELLGWRNATKTGLSVIAFGGIGKTWVRESQELEFNQRYGAVPHVPENWHLEAGLSLSNIFSILRVDAAYRIDEPGFFIGLNIARFF